MTGRHSPPFTAIHRHSPPFTAIHRHSPLRSDGSQAVRGDGLRSVRGDGLRSVRGDGLRWYFCGRWFCRAVLSHLLHPPAT